MSGATTNRVAIWKVCQGVKSSVATMKTILVFTLMSLLRSFGASLSGHLSGYASTMRTRFRVDSRARGSVMGSEWNVFVDRLGRHRRSGSVDLRLLCGRHAG